MSDLLHDKFGRLVISISGPVFDIEYGSPEFLRWLSVWSMGAVCEATEVFVRGKTDDLTLEEVGDVLWYLKALDMLLGRDDFSVIDDFLPSCRYVMTGEDYQRLSVQLGLWLNQVKKFVRNYPLSELQDVSSLKPMVEFFGSRYNCLFAFNFVQAKLRLRYPFGFFGQSN